MKSKFGIGMILVVMLLVSLLFVPAASAMSGQPIGTDIASKSASKSVTSTAITQTNSDSDTAKKNVYNSYVQLKTYFHGTLVSGVTTVTFTGDGKTNAQCGSTPTPNFIALSSQVTISGVSLTISYPPSVGVSSSGNTVTYSGSWSNTKTANHTYENLKVISRIAIYGQDQDDGATFRFGNTDHTLYTHTSL
jgi:hypothetical protein